MSSPAIFILGVGCIINNWFSEWVCSYLGVAEHLWVAGVVPSFVVYHMCDRSRLNNAARALFRFSADLRTLVSILSVGLIALVSVHFKLALWMLLAMAGCIYFLAMSFSAEKTMYVGDWCGAVAKQVFRKVMMNFICEVAWMKMKGEWHFCSPYSRHLEVKSTDHYYTLKKPALIDSSNAASYEEEEEFTVCFPIEECEMFCKFQYLMNRRNGIERKDGPNKVEVSLLYKRDPLEEYTYLNVPMIRVARLKRLITILKDEGNLVLSNVHENVGSELNLAHARCYEFEEMLKLVLSDGWTLKKINLRAEYLCSISGSSFPRGTATGLILGLICCVICTLGKLSLGGSATVFAVAIFIICNRGDRHCKVVEEIKTESSSLAESNFVCICGGGSHCTVVEEIKTGSSSLAESNSVVRHVQDFQRWSGDKGRPLVMDDGFKRAGNLFTSE